MLTSKETAATDKKALLHAVPADVRHRIVSGMRWTVWLSMLSIPFTYGVNLLLARTSPEALGTYGLLGIYISLVTCFFYLGGDAVAIKFIPTLEPGDRLSFLASYFLIVCAALMPWLIVAAFWPKGVHYLLGQEGSDAFHFFLLCLSPVYILFLLVAASLKGTLEIRWAQVILRLATLGSFVCYAVLYTFDREFLASHYRYLIWGIYLALVALAAALGFFHLNSLPGWQRHWKEVRFFLPRGFWRYTLSTQQVSVVNFFLQRMDYVLILNFGGLTVLGKYTAILTMAVTILVISNFFLDTLLPSLTNLVATGNYKAASQVFSVQMRIVFLVTAASTCGLVLLASPLTALFGPKYSSLSGPVAIMALLVGLASPGVVGGTLLSSVGKQQRAVWVTLGQLTLYGVLFWFLWPRFELLGAVLAYGFSQLIANTALLITAHFSVPISFSITREYTALALVALASGALIAGGRTPGLMMGGLAWLGAVALYLLLGNYRLNECKRLVQWFMPLAPQPAVTDVEPGGSD
jgi:O-antigen/teichoic acid export membrane protein